MPEILSPVVAICKQQIKSEKIYKVSHLNPLACVVSLPCLVWIFCVYLPTIFFTFLAYSLSRSPLSLIYLANTEDRSSPPLVTWLRTQEYLSHNSLPQVPIVDYTSPGLVPDTAVPKTSTG